MALNFPDFEIPSLSQIWAETSSGPSCSFLLISGSSRQFIIFFSAEARRWRGSRISAQFIMRAVAYQGVCARARGMLCCMCVSTCPCFRTVSSDVHTLKTALRFPHCWTESISKKIRKRAEVNLLGVKAFLISCSPQVDVSVWMEMRCQMELAPSTEQWLNAVILSRVSSHMSDIDQLLRCLIISFPIGQHVNTC